MALTPTQKQALLEAASIVANETEVAANTANRIGTLFARIINALGDGVDINELKAMFLSKTTTDTAAEIITFAKGFVSVLQAVFQGGISVAGGATINDGASIDELEVGTDLTVRGDATVAGTLRVITKLIAAAIEATNITTTNLTVTGVAHFFQLVIDELTSNKGAIIISHANCKVDAVDTYTNYYDVFFRATDADGATIINSWKANDLAICMAFNGLHTGINNGVSNKYYWRKVTSIASNVTRADGNVYHRIRLSNSGSNFDGTGVPEVGDVIVQLGYTGTNDAARRSAIILSAYATPDTGLTAPSLAFYRGINDFSLATHRKTYFDANGADFYGNFHVGPNEDGIDNIEQLILKTYIAYCNGITTSGSSTTYTDFTTTPAAGAAYAYLGICVTAETTQPTDPARYTWTRVKGADGQNGQNGQDGQDGQDGSDGVDGENGQEYKIEDYGSSFEVGLDYTTSMRLILGAWHFVNNAGTLMTSAYLYWKIRYLTTSEKTGSTRYNYFSRINESYSNGDGNDGNGIYKRTLELAAKSTTTDVCYYTNVLGVEIELRDSTASSGYKVLARYFIPQSLKKGATFDIDQELGQITQRVTNAESTILGHTTSLSDHESRITQNSTSITQEVTNRQTQYNTLNGNINQVSESVGQLQVTAESINMKVSQQSKENENYVRNASLASLPWIDREWTRLDTVATIRSRITSHIFRYTSTSNSPKLSGDTNTAYCAVLSSYINRAAGSVPSAATISKGVTVTSGYIYTMSIWARKQMYCGNVAFGIGEGNMTIKGAKAYNSSGSEDSSVTVSINNEGHYVQFVPTDDAWHLFVVVMEMTAASIAPWYRVWGNGNGNYADWLISRPCLRRYNGIETATYRTYTATSTNLFTNSAFGSSDIALWRVAASVTVNGTSYGYSYNGSTVTLDKLSDYIINRMWNTETWKNSLLMAGSVDAVNFTANATTRNSHSRDFQQAFTSQLGSELYGKTLCFSVYIKRSKKWGGASYTAGSSSPTNTYGLGVKITNVNTSTITASADDTTAVTIGSRETVSSVWSMFRFSPADDEWHRIWIKFSLASAAEFAVGFHLNITNGVADDWVITKPKLEIGETPTGWVDYTSEEIKTVLKEAGIDIDAGGVNIHGENISLEGTVTANGGFKIGLDGSMEANNGTFAGFVRTMMHAVTPKTIASTLSEATDFINPETYYYGEQHLEPVECEEGIWCDILKLGSSVVFHHNGGVWDNSRFPYLDYTAAIHLPFVSETAHGVVSTFENAYHTVYTGDESLYKEVLFARSFAGCRMEIINMSGGTIMLCGIGESEADLDAHQPWNYYLLYSGTLIIVECVRETSNGINSVKSDRVYWKIVGKQINLSIPASVFGLDGTSG